MSGSLMRAALCAALLAIPASAWAHAHLKTAEPAVDATVAGAPTQLKLHFSEGVEAEFSSVALADAAGKPVAGIRTATDPADKSTLVATLPGLAPGAYKVSWHATAVDTHKTDGEYGFTVAAAGAAIPPIQVQQPWARATAGTLGSGIVYAVIRNVGAADDTLVAASTPVARLAELHRTVEEKGVSSMPPVAGIEVKAGGQASLAPGGYHVMLVDLKQALVAGQTVPLTLTFAKAGKVEVSVTIEKISAGGPGDMPGMKM